MLGVESLDGNPRVKLGVQAAKHVSVMRGEIGRRAKTVAS